ncbi:MAG TPA: malate dehydrogenase (quinone) [Chthoniobacterales bacterium]
MPKTGENSDVVLIGSGIMSANLGALLKRLDPRLTIQVFEVTDGLAQESSHGWNNAGTGHAGICELSYTPKREADGTVSAAHPIKIFEQFEKSLQFWGSAVRDGMVTNPSEFINPVPHLSFVHGEEQVDFLRARHAAMSAHHFFEEMVYSTDRATIGSWAPLLVEGRGEVPIAATRMDDGTDVNFGSIARKLLAWLGQQEGCGIAAGHRVIDIRKDGTGWELEVRELATGHTFTTRTKFVFVGAGGGSLPLLQKSGIPESRGIGGFPIGGQWIVCDNPEIVAKHQAKVYGQALGAAPTMAVPHLDTRILDGKKTLLFGPFAAWTTKFLHGKGSPLDLPLSIKPHNLATLVNVGIHNLDLVRYLVQQGTQSMSDRMDVLHVFYPAAKASDWRLIDAGIRVQAIKETDGKAGIVHYGTEVITNQERTISALLGASPGASVSVDIVLEVIRTCLPHLLEGPTIRELIPTFGIDIKQAENAAFFRNAHARAEQHLKLRP